MAHETIAPWAEKVPVAGVLVRSPYHGFWQGALITDLMCVLADYVDAHGLGEVIGAHTGFILSQPGEPDTVLAPDITFIRTESMPPRGTPELEGYLRLAPDVAIEGASSDMGKPEMAAKARTYLQAGVRLVWVIWPETKTADVWRPGSDQPIMTLTISDALDGLNVVPGFTYPLADLFG
jgi:Uma2 family endonuclease